MPNEREENNFYNLSFMRRLTFL